jgi:hypothetical protein
MIWDDVGFQRAYRTRLRSVEASADAEVRAQAMAFQAEARAGGSSGEHFTQRAGAAAAILLSGYVRGAIEAFDQTLAAVQAELEDADVNALRASLEQEIARKAKALPASLRDFTKPGVPPPVLRAVLEQAPVKARQVLAERVSEARGRVRTRVRAGGVPDRPISIRHDAHDVALAETLRLAIREAVGSDAASCTSSDREATRALEKSRMALSLLTQQSAADPVLWWTLGVAQGAGKPAFAVRTAGVSLDATLPLRAEQIIDLSNRDDVVRLLRAVQAELRRREKDVSELDLADLLRVAAS